MNQTFTRIRLVCRMLFLLLGIAAPLATFGQATAPDDFGRNRIQYKRFEWQYYSTPNFNVYFSQGGNELARHTAEFAEKELKRITTLIGYYPYSKITLIVYNSVSDLRQSNIGLNDDPFKGGNDALFVQSKIEVPFEGSQTELKRQVSYRISELLLSDMMYGGSLKEVIQSNYLLRLPDWFISGAAAYISEGWGVEMDNYVRDMIQKTGGKKSDPLFARNQRLTGQAVWNYIAERHGVAAIQNILNLTRITRDIEIGIASSLNRPYKRFETEWFDYYRQGNTFGEQLATPAKENKVKKRNSRNNLYTEPVISPNGKRLAYVVYDRGSYKVMVQDLDRNRKKTIYKGGFKMPNQQMDRTVPLLAWRTESQLGISDYRRGKLRLRLQEASRRSYPLLDDIKGLLGNTRNILPLNQYSQITGFDYSDDGQSLVLSAVKDSQSDLFVYRGGRLSRQLTNDVYDDLQPVFLPDGNKIAFSSNRVADSAQAAQGVFANVVNNYDIYLYDPTTDLRHFWQLTYSASNETAPFAISDEELLYLGEESGVRALYRQNIKNGVVSRVSNFQQNIKDYSYNPRTGNLAFVALDKAKEYVYAYPGFQLTAATNTAFKTQRQQVLEGRVLRQRQLAQQRLEAAQKAKAAADSLAAARLALGGDSTLTTPVDSTTLAVTAPKPVTRPGASSRPRSVVVVAPSDTLVLNRPRNYDLRFSVNGITSTLYADPLLGFGFVAEIGMGDLFEDYRFKGGVFAETDLQTTNFYAEYSNLKHRYDYRIGFQRQSVYLDNDIPIRRLVKHEIMPAFGFPITNALSIRVLPRYSNVRYTNIENFAQPDITLDFIGGGGELVFDNSAVTGMNMREGTRMKVGVTSMKAIGKPEESFGKFYVDLRHYQKIHKELIWANRFSYGQSFGKSPKRFLLGGTNNWVNNKEDSPIYDNTTNAADFFYLDFATNLRGFNYNARNGTRYVLWNSELRVPLIQYLYDGPINSGFFRNLQLIGFFDAGTAYSAGNPFSKSNSVNTEIISQPPFVVTVSNFRNPFMYGYGGGARTTLLGMYARFDMAWGEHDMQKVGPKFYFSLGYDF